MVTRYPAHLSLANGLGRDSFGHRVCVILLVTVHGLREHQSWRISRWVLRRTDAPK